MTLDQPGKQDRVVPDALMAALALFLEKVSIVFAGDLNRAAEHLRFPADSWGTLTGSALGLQLWESEEGRRVVGLFLQNQQLRDWFEDRPIELRSAVASVVKSWATSGQTSLPYVAQSLPSILDSLEEQTKSGWAIGVAYGVRVPRRIDLPNGSAIDPEVNTMLQNLVANRVLDETHLIRMPKSYSCVLLHGSSVPRSSFGPIAGTTATVWSQLALHRLRNAIWMACGTLPTVGDIFVTEVSPYPITPLTHLPAPVQSYPQTPASTLNDPELASLARLVLRLEALWRGALTDVDTDTDLQLRLALSHTEAVLSTPDSLLAALLTYVALEGLLLYPEDDVSRLTPRLSWLIGASDENRRELRRFVAAFGELRGHIGHGNPPSRDTLSRLLGREVTPDEVDAYFSWSGHEAGRLLEMKCRELLRKVLVSFLNLALDVQDDEVSARLTRREIIERLESAVQRDAGAASARALLEENARAL